MTQILRDLQGRKALFIGTGLVLLTGALAFWNWRSIQNKSNVKHKKSREIVEEKKDKASKQSQIKKETADESNTQEQTNALDETVIIVAKESVTVAENGMDEESVTVSKESVTVIEDSPVVTGNEPVLIEKTSVADEAAAMDESESSFMTGNESTVIVETGNESTVIVETENASVHVDEEMVVIGKSVEVSQMEVLKAAEASEITETVQETETAMEETAVKESEITKEQVEKETEAAIEETETAKEQQQQEIVADEQQQQQEQTEDANEQQQEKVVTEQTEDANEQQQQQEVVAEEHTEESMVAESHFDESSSTKSHSLSTVSTEEAYIHTPEHEIETKKADTHLNKSVFDWTDASVKGVESSVVMDEKEDFVVVQHTEEDQAAVEADMPQFTSLKSTLTASAPEFVPKALQHHKKPNKKVMSREQLIESQRQHHIPRSKARCSHWPHCTNNNCKFFHPYKPCRAGDECLFGSKCMFVHPKDCIIPTREAKGESPSSSLLL